MTFNRILPNTVNAFYEKGFVDASKGRESANALLAERTSPEALLAYRRGLRIGRRERARRRQT